MKNEFKKLQTVCRHVGQFATQPNPANRQSLLKRLMAAVREYRDSGEDSPTLILRDEVHGAADILHLGDPVDAMRFRKAGNELYQIADDTNGVAVMTGEQLTSLAKQWLAFTAGRRVGIRADV